MKSELKPITRDRPCIGGYAVIHEPSEIEIRANIEANNWTDRGMLSRNLKSYPIPAKELRLSSKLEDESSNEK